MNPVGQLSNVTFTPADVYDGHVTSRLVRLELVVGDSHYGGRIDRGEALARAWGHRGGAGSLHPETQLMAEWQQVLLNLRAKIEGTFDTLKEHVPFVSSFPRSLDGYVLPYVRILLGYQMGWGY